MCARFKIVLCFLEKGCEELEVRFCGSILDVGRREIFPDYSSYSNKVTHSPHIFSFFFSFFLIWVLPIKSDKTELRIQIHNRMEKNKNLVESFLIGFLLPFL